MFKGRMLNAANFVLPELAGSAVKGSLLPPARSSFYSRPPMCADYTHDFISHMVACLKVGIGVKLVISQIMLATIFSEVLYGL